MATTLKLENQGKPTPPIWKKVGKWLVRLSPVVTGTVILLPIPVLLKGMIIFSANLLLAIGKELTTYTFDPEKVPLSYFPQIEVPQAPATKNVTKTVERIAEIKATQEEISK